MFLSKTGFINIKANGKRAMKLENNDKLIQVLLAGDDNDIILSTSKGKCVRFSVTDIRVFSGRTSMGVRGIKLQKNDRIISAARNAIHTCTNLIFFW